MTSMNLYCGRKTDMSRDGRLFRVVGALTCPTLLSGEVNEKLRDIVNKYDLEPESLRWSKTSSTSKEFYLEVLKYFFSHEDLSFSVVIAPVEGIDEGKFEEVTDELFYKIICYLIGRLIPAGEEGNIYLFERFPDVERGLQVLHGLVAHAEYYFKRKGIHRIPVFEYHDEALVHLADFFVGAINYVNNHNAINWTRCYLVRHIRKLSGANLIRISSLSETKMGIFRWGGRIPLRKEIMIVEMETITILVLKNTMSGSQR